jgi:hypothetical protein
LDSADATLQAVIGDIAHIVADKPDGPRGQSPLAAEERDNPANLVLLCANDHRSVDGNEADYPVARLLQIKETHERWVTETLSLAPKINLKLSTLNYINVPRLAILATMNGQRIAGLNSLMQVKSLNSLGFELVQVMLAFEKVLNALAFAALEMTPRMAVDDRLVGMACAFNTRFRTKNIKGLSAEDQVTFSGNLKKDPHVYTKVSEWRLVLPINPRWVTTNTAFVDFTSGGIRLAGLCSVKSIDKAGKIIYATPFVIGHPPNQFMDELFGRDGESGSSTATPQDT